MKLEGFTEYKKEDIEKYNSLRWWLGVTFGDIFDKATDLYPRREALVDDKVRLSYCQLRERVDKLAIGLIKLGIKKGDRVLIQLPNWGEFVYSFFALQKIGAIVVLLVPQYAQIEINHLSRLTHASAWILPEKYRKIDYLPIINDVLKTNSKIKHVILARGHEGTQFTSLEMLMRDAELDEKNILRVAKRRPNPMEVALLLPSGGTTGLPKVAPRTHNDYICSVEYHTRALEQNINDIYLVVTPVGHNAPLMNGIVGPIINFCKIVLLDSTRVEDICRVIQEEKVTGVTLVPALARRLVNFEGLGNYNLSSLVKIGVGGAHSTSDLIRGVYEKIGCKCINSFGMVEGPLARVRLDDDFDTIYNTVGRPSCPYDEFKIIDENGNELPPNTEGELVAKGPGLFTGYLKLDNRKFFTKDGFFRTGDLATIDESGNIRITGRIKDIIIRGGENISAIDIEELISSHPKVEDVAVIGMPDEDLGEKVCAYIQPLSETTLSFEEIISFLVNKGASKLLLPERIEFIDKIPLTEVGKPDKKALRSDIKKRLGMI